MNTNVVPHKGQRHCSYRDVIKFQNHPINVQNTTDNLRFAYCKFFPTPATFISPYPFMTYEGPRTQEDLCMVTYPQNLRFSYCNNNNNL